MVAGEISSPVQPGAPKEGVGGPAAHPDIKDSSAETIDNHLVPHACRLTYKTGRAGRGYKDSDGLWGLQDGGVQL